MNLRTKLLTYVIVVTIVTAFAISYHYFKQREVYELYVSKVLEQKQLLFSTATELKGDPFRKVLIENSMWDEMIKFVSNPDKKWAEENINTFLDIHKANAVWIYNNNLKITYGIKNLDDGTLETMPCPENGIKELFLTTKFPHFFIKSKFGLLEVFGASIHPTNDFNRETPPVGYFFVGKLWDSTYVDNIEKITETDITIITKSDTEQNSDNPNFVSFVKNIDDIWSKNQISSVKVSVDISRLKDMKDLSQKNFNNVLIFFSAFFILTVFLFRKWIYVPIQDISTAFEKEDIGYIKYLEKSKDAFGNMYKMIQGFFNQKKEIETSRNQFVDMFEKHSAVMMLIDPATKKIINVNNAAVNFYGYNSNELKGLNISKINNQSDENISRDIEKAVMNQQNYFVFKHKTASGYVRDVEVYSTPIKTQNAVMLFSIIHDITERRRVEEALLLSETRLRRIFEEAPVGIIQGTKGSRRVNKAFTEITGYSESEYKSIPALELTNAEDLEVEEKLYKEMYNGTRNRFDMQERIYTKSGSEIWINLIAASVRDAMNNVIDEISIIDDITERKNTEEALKIAKEAAESAGRAKSAFLSNISHEIRNPLNAIIGFTEILLMKDFSEKDIENLKAIKFSADNLLRIVNDILDFSKIEAGKIEFEEINFDVRELVKNIVKSYELKAAEKGIAIHKHIGNSIPEILTGDSLRLTQILTNLLSNSVKFTKEGSIAISLNTEKTEKEKILVKFTVSDTGIGIPPEKANEIFESFTQGYADTARKFGGTGLGLSITKRLVEMQDGNIYFESELNKGTIFTVILPFKYSSAEIQETGAVDLNPGILENKKVLIIEDNVINQFFLKKLLSGWKMIVALSSSGSEAITKLQNEVFDIVISDIQMPGMSGYETVEFIRNPQSGVLNHKIPVIAFTADASSETQKRVNASKFTDIIVKPTPNEVILDKILRAVSK